VFAFFDPQNLKLGLLTALDFSLFYFTCFFPEQYLSYRYIKSIEKYNKKQSIIFSTQDFRSRLDL